MYRKVCGLETEMRTMRSLLDTNRGNNENINIDYLPADSVEEFDSLEKKKQTLMIKISFAER